MPAYAMTDVLLWYSDRLLGTAGPPDPSSLRAEADPQLEALLRDLFSQGALGSMNPALIPVGFRSLEMIVNDFLETVSSGTCSVISWCLVCCPSYSDHARVMVSGHMEMLVSVIGLYSSQRVDTNISFTSIGLLWRCATSPAERYSLFLTVACLLCSPAGCRTMLTALNPVRVQGHQLRHRSVQGLLMLPRL